MAEHFYPDENAPRWAERLIAFKKGAKRMRNSVGSQENSKNANYIVSDAIKALTTFFKWREGKQLTADTVNEIETFAKEYESNL